MQPDYKLKRTAGTYVIWLRGVNRYLQLQKPAFEVFSEWAGGKDKLAIAAKITLKYRLPEEESEQFVKEITGKIGELYLNPKPEPEVRMSAGDSFGTVTWHSEKCYKAGDFLFRFFYADPYLEELFHPLFSHLQTIFPENANELVFRIWYQDDCYAYATGQGNPVLFPEEETDRFQGALFLELLNMLHQKEISGWMGVLHASAVSNGKSAVLFTAPSGSGKTSVALLMMAAGYTVISDDFTPIALEKPEVFHFPSSLSVKEGGIPLLKRSFPEKSVKNFVNPDDPSVYVAPSGDPHQLIAPVEAKALVFVSFKPGSGCRLKKESNLQMMNALLRQIWISNTPEAAECFMEWYFNLRVYSLTYSDNEKAVAKLKKIFGDE